MSGDRFRWHPKARLMDAGGVWVDPAAKATTDRPSAGSLAAALASDAAFRIGGPGGPPAEGAQPMFETLTSGSTGTPRRIWRTQASWIASFRVNAGLFGIGPSERVAVLGALVQSLALYAALEGLHLGAEVHLLDGLRPDRQMLALQTRRVGVLYATPVQLRLLAEAGGQAPALRLVVVGGAKLDAALRRALTTLARNAVVREFYGAAEASFITLTDAQSPDDSVGAPYPGVEISLHEGAIWVRSPYLFAGYAGEDPGGALWDQGWLSVGEMGRMEAGYLYVLGRAGRMVTVADQNVFPEAIEAFLAGLPGVRRVAVIAQPDALRGKVMVAVVMGDESLHEVILSAARRQFGRMAAPRRIIWRDDWLDLPSGKTDLARIEREAGA